jgi:hypothetical protein
MPRLSAVLPFTSYSDRKGDPNAAIAELTSLSRTPVLLEKAPDLSLEIELLSDATKHRGLKRQIAAANDVRVGRKYLRLSVDVPDKLQRVDTDHSDLSEHHRSLIVVNLYEYKFMDRIGDLVLACNLAKPGLLHFDRIYVYLGGRHRRTTSGFTGVVGEATDYARQLGWPPILDLPIPRVWDWLNALPRFSTGMASGRVGRAVSALSFLMRPDLELSPSDLVWALLGLEALYCSGAQGKQSQLIEKSSLLLGPNTTNASKFREMYEYRSRFLHGNFDFPRAYIDMNDDAAGEFRGDAYECWSLASCLLIATLQEMVNRDLNELNFRYALN